MFLYPDVLCSSCLRSPSRSSWAPQSTVAQHPPAFQFTTVSPPTSYTLRNTRRVVAAKLRHHRRWESVPLRVLLFYIPSFGVSVGYQGKLSLPLGWVCSDIMCFYCFLFSTRPVRLHPQPALHISQTRGRLHHSNNKKKMQQVLQYSPEMAKSVGLNLHLQSGNHSFIKKISHCALNTTVRNE